MAGDKSRGKTTPIAKRKKVNTSEKRDYPDDEDGTPNKVKKSEDDDSFEETGNLFFHQLFFNVIVSQRLVQSWGQTKI